MTEPRLAKSTNAGRFYTWKGEDYVSVTTVLNAMNKPALVPWAAKMVAEQAVEMAEELPSLVRADREGTLRTLKRAPYRKKDAAADKGTVVHEIAERIAKGEKPGAVSPEVAPYVRSFLMFVDDHQPEFLHTEVTLFSKKHRYAGTTDFIARLPKMGTGANAVYIGDYKTSKGLYPEVALQLAAYAHADFMADGDNEADVTATDGAVAVHIRKDGYSLIPVKVHDKVFGSFLHVLGVWRWQQYGAPTVLGEAVE